ncbi:MAG: hypothetical protein ABIQ18_35920, partial [Umezawaea sp.]
VDKFETWIDRIRDEHDKYSYRYIYCAYMDASGRPETTTGETTMEVLPGGGYVLRDGGHLELHLIDDAEREAFVAYLVARYCRDVYPDMAAWEDQRHAWYMEDEAW